MAEKNRIRYVASKTGARFHASNAFARFIMGPVGSGKTVTLCAEVFSRGMRQEKGIDGLRRSRWIFVRNTYPELKSTTIKTWLDWFPEDIFGRVKWNVPIEHTVRYKDMVLEAWFLALDQPKHVKKLLSLEATGVVFNEVREIPKALVDAATTRIGRFPSMKDKPAHIPEKNWPTFSGIFGDTNPPDDDHWYYRLAEEQIPTGWEFFTCPAAMFETQGGEYVLNVNADNLKNLPVGYYERMIAGKHRDWINIYVLNRYGSTMEGKPVHPEFNEFMHVAKGRLLPHRGLPLLLGWDYGRTPACSVNQVTARGQFRTLAEFVSENMGVKQFAENVVKPRLFREFTGLEFESIGDPAGSYASQESDEITCMEILGSVGIPTRPAPTNVFTARREALADFMNRNVDGFPGYLLDPTCKVLRKGFRGGYQYRRLQVPGDERFTEVPDKNAYSHPCESVQYAALEVNQPRTHVKRRLRRSHSAGPASAAGY